MSSEPIKNSVTLYSCAKVWKSEKRMYAIPNLMVFPTPIDLYELLYMFLSVVFALLLCAIFPLFNALPFVVKYFAIPFFLSKFLAKKKLDGKSPIPFFICWIKYMGSKNEYVERFEWHKTEKDIATKLEWNISRGCC